MGGFNSVVDAIPAMTFVTIEFPAYQKLSYCPMNLNYKCFSMVVIIFCSLDPFLIPHLSAFSIFYSDLLLVIRLPLLFFFSRHVIVI